MKYKAIIYDLDGTIVDTLETNFVPLQQLIKEELQLDIPYEELIEYATNPGMKTIASLGFSDIDSAYKKWVEKIHAYPTGAKVYPDVQQVLETVREMDITQAVVSSKKRAQYLIDIVHQGLGKYFKVDVLEDDTTRHKPDPEPLLLCCLKLGLKPNEVVYIGDGYSDYQSCLAANIDFAWARWGSLEKKPMDPTYTLQTPLDILQIL